jgi:hypothetical protein
MAHTIPRRSHDIYKFPKKQSSISSAATLENLHINTCITEYTSIKRVNTTLELLLCKKRKGIPLKMFVTPSSFASRNGRCQANPTTPTKGKGEKEQKLRMRTVVI